MNRRFFTLDSILNETVQLKDEQAHHALHVLRVKPGQVVVVFDGSGWEATGEVKSVSKRSVEVEIRDRIECDRELPFQLRLAVALPKGDRQRTLVEKLTEVGVHSLIPLKTERSVAQPVEKAIERMRKQVIESSKQCERNRLMEINDPMTFHELIVDDETSDFQKLIASTHLARTSINETKAANTLMLIGPEGGFSENEVNSAIAAGFFSVQLGGRILRIETAAITAAAILGIGNEEKIGLNRSTTN